MCFETDFCYDIGNYKIPTFALWNNYEVARYICRNCSFKLVIQFGELEELGGLDRRWVLVKYEGRISTCIALSNDWMKLESITNGLTASKNNITHIELNFQSPTLSALDLKTTQNDYRRGFLILLSKKSNSVAQQAQYKISCTRLFVFFFSYEGFVGAKLQICAWHFPSIVWIRLYGCIVSMATGKPS